MCNYFSVGVESRIGLGFDKKRTANAVCNKIVYGWEGMKKLFCCCQSTPRVREVIDYVATIDPESGRENIIFATDKKSDQHHLIRGNPVSFVCTNINSIMGG